MTKLIAILATLEPVILTVLGLAALAVVPLLVWAVFKHLDEKQQRFAYDVAKGLADTMDLFKEATPSKVDDAIASIARDVEQQIGRKLKPKALAAVASAVRLSAVKRAA